MGGWEGNFSYGRLEDVLFSLEVGDDGYFVSAWLMLGPRQWVRHDTGVFERCFWSRWAFEPVD